MSVVVSEDVSTAAAILEDVLGRLPGLTPDLAGRELDAVAREALARVACWKLDFALSSRAGATDYRLDPRIAGTRVSAVLAVRYLDATLTQHMPRLQELATGAPRYWWIQAPGLLRLWPAAEVTRSGAITIRGILTPIDGIAPVPEDMLQPLREMLLNGTLSRLYVMPGKPWSAPPLAIRHHRLYRSQMNRLRQDYAASTSPAGAEWAYPRGWSRHG